MRLLSLLLIVLDLIVLWKLLIEEERKPSPTACKVVNIEERPRRVVPAEVLAVEEEAEVDLEEIKEAFRLKVIERRKAWERDYIWNKEDNLRNFRLKHGIPVEDIVDTNTIEEHDRGLFSLTAT